MSIFEDWGKKISEVAEVATEKAKEVAGSAADKTKEMVEIARLSSDISSEEKMINKVYSELGEIVFDQEKDDEDSIYKDKIDKIKTHLKNIDECQKKIKDLKNESQATAKEEQAGNNKEYVDITPPPATEDAKKTEETNENGSNDNSTETKTEYI